MPLPQTKSIDEEAEIILCRGPTQCESPKEVAMPNLHLHKRQRELVGGGDSDQRQEKHVWDPRSQRRSMILVSSALRGMHLKLT